MHYLLDFTYLVGLVVLSPWLIYKAFTTGKYPRGLWYKLSGCLPPSTHDSTIRNPQSALQKVVWFHGVSVGEIHLLRPVVAGFRSRNPGWTCVISTTTDTGFEEARKRFSDVPIIYWPLDFSWAVNRTLDLVNPRLVVLAEGELWPNFLLAAKKRNVKVAVINGRMSPRSLQNHQRFAWLVRRLLSCIDLFAVQTEEYAKAFRELGAVPERVRVTGSVKYDGVSGDRNNLWTQELGRLLGKQPGDLIWLAGSTQAPEEALALDIYRKVKPEFAHLRLLLVPRQRERFEEVANLLHHSGLPWIRRSKLSGPVTDRDAVILIDTIGELGALWGLADVAFVGGSLDGQRGGQNMIEPAAYGSAVVFGPHVWNFHDTAKRLVKAGAAVQVGDSEALERVMWRLLGSEEERRRLGNASRDFVREQQGATEKTMALLNELLGSKRLQTKAA